MFSPKKIPILSFILLLTLFASLVFPFSALADEASPTPPPDSPVVETAAPGGGTNTVQADLAAGAASNLTQVSPTEAAATDVTANTTVVVPTADIPANPVATDTPADAPTAAPVESTPEVVAALSDSGAMILDQNGESVPLGSQQAAAVLSGTDPWFNAGGGYIVAYSATGVCVAGAAECHTTTTPIQSAINDIRSNGTTIFVEQGIYNEDVTIAKQVILTGLGTGAITNSFTLNSGANTTGSSNIFAPVINVNSGAKVQNGVDLAAAGGTVNVGPGNYREQVVINGKNITLKASAPGAVIEAPDVVPTCFTTSAPQKPIICVKNATNVTIKGLTIDGRGVGDGIHSNNRFDGIGYYNSGGTVQGNTIERIRDTPLSGIQDGVGLYVYNQDGTSRTINVFDNAIFDYQKNGMALSGNGLTALVQNNTLTGAGPTSLTAQNGIQISYGAVGTVSGNTVSGNFWTGTYGGTNNPISDPKSDGAAGILVYQPGAGTIQIFNNNVLGNQFGIASVDAPGLNIHDNTIQGIAHTGFGYPTGIAIWGSTGIATYGNIQNNTITTSDYGVLISNTPNVAIHNNSITLNTIYGVWSDMRTDATNNWWGNASGPHDSSPVPDVCGLTLTNPAGTGNAASACVLYNPWLTNNPFAGSGPVTPPSGGVSGESSGRGGTALTNTTLLIPVTGGQQTSVGCDSQSETLQIEDIKVTLDGLCGYDIVLETVLKDNLPGDLSLGDKLEDGVIIKLLQGGKLIETLPPEASLQVAYPKPDNGSVSVLTWNGSAWAELTSFINGTSIITDLPAPSTLVLVTH